MSEQLTDPVVGLSLSEEVDVEHRCDGFGFDVLLESFVFVRVGVCLYEHVVDDGGGLEVWSVADRVGAGVSGAFAVGGDVLDELVEVAGVDVGSVGVGVGDEFADPGGVFGDGDVCEVAGPVVDGGVQFGAG